MRNRWLGITLVALAQGCAVDYGSELFGESTEGEEGALAFQYRGSEGCNDFVRGCPLDAPLMVGGTELVSIALLDADATAEESEDVLITVSNPSVLALVDEGTASSVAIRARGEGEAWLTVSTRTGERIDRVRIRTADPDRLELSTRTAEDEQPLGEDPLELSLSAESWPSVRVKAFDAEDRELRGANGVEWTTGDVSVAGVHGYDGSLGAVFVALLDALSRTSVGEDGETVLEPPPPEEESRGELLAIHGVAEGEVDITAQASDARAQLHVRIVR